MKRSDRVRATTGVDNQATMGQTSGNGEQIKRHQLNLWPNAVPPLVDGQSEPKGRMFGMFAICNAKRIIEIAFKLLFALHFAHSTR